MTVRSTADALVYRFGFDRLFESDENQYDLWLEVLS